jgi:hypothetical protein
MSRFSEGEVNRFRAWYRAGCGNGTLVVQRKRAKYKDTLVETDSRPDWYFAPKKVRGSAWVCWIFLALVWLLPVLCALWPPELLP